MAASLYNNAAKAAFTISNAGGNQAHNNLQPYIVQNFIIKAYNNARTLSIVENSLDSDSTKNAASVHSVNNIKPIEISYKVINQSSGSAITPQEFINLWFGDETHTVNDMIEVFNKIHNGNAICYTIQSNISSTVKTILPINVQIRTLSSASSYYFRYNRLHVSWIFPAGVYYSQIIDLPREETGSVEIYGKESYYIEPYDDLDSTNINKSLSANQGRVLNEKITSLTTYSTTETKTGETWIDGKPLYKKVYEGIAINSNETIIDNISGIDVKMIYGWLVKTAEGFIQPLGSYDSMENTSTSRVFYGSPYIKVQAASHYQTGEYTTRVIIEYTKTTD